VLLYPSNLLLQTALKPSSRLYHYILVNNLCSTDVPAFLKLALYPLLSDAPGEKLEGDVVEDTGYALNVNEGTTCTLLCERSLDAKDVLHFRGAIADQYTVQMTVDGLPAAMRESASATMEDNGEPYFSRGWPVGFIAQDGKYYLNNHLRIQVRCLLHICTFHSNSVDTSSVRSNVTIVAAILSYEGRFTMRGIKRTHS
jgi:hypothetical protein